MTRYANLQRNADIVALYILQLPPKRIVLELKPRYPELTLWCVYKVLRRSTGNHLSKFGKDITGKY